MTDSLAGNAIKTRIAIGCGLVVLLGLMVAVRLQSERAAEREQIKQRLEQKNRELAIERLHNTDEKPVYDLINHESFDDRLPADTRVVWVYRTYGTNWSGLTDWDRGRPEISINAIYVKTEKEMVEVIQHEMCHVALHQWGTEDVNDFHGPAFQACMTRYH